MVWGHFLGGEADCSGPTEEIVLGLAKGVNKNLKSDWTIGESGTCGPTGRSQPNRTPYYPQTSRLIVGEQSSLQSLGRGWK